MIRLSSALLLFIVFACNNGETVIKPEQKRLIEAVYASGHVIALNEYEVFAQAEGYVVEKLVRDGDDLKRGAPIYILESGQQSARFTLAKKNYAVAADNYRGGSPALKEAEAVMEATQTRMHFDSINHVRYRNLLEKNATSRGEFDRMRLAYDNSRSEYQLQKSRYEQLRNRLFLELESARSQLEIASNESGKYIIRSDADGKVFRTLKEKGELIRRGEPVAVIGNQDTFYLQLAVDELDIRRLKKGQEIMVTIDALPQKVYTAHVDKIYPIVNRQQQSIRVDAVFQDTIPMLFSGLAVEANIVIRKKDNALVVPRSALIGSDSLKIIRDDDPVVIRIKKGIETLEEVEITDGIGPSTPVVIGSSG